MFDISSGNCRFMFTGIKFNWSLYLLNVLIKDVMLTQHKEDHKFYYSWLLILISFTNWADPPDYVQMDVPLSFLSARYQNLWEDKVDNNHQQDNNIVFFMHAEALREVVQHSHRIRTATVHRYVAFIKFQADAHNITLLPTSERYGDRRRCGCSRQSLAGGMAWPTRKAAA